MAIVAIDADDHVLLVRQYRSPAERVLLEIPAGTLDVDDASGRTEEPDLAARRELEEETGYRAATWQRLAAFWTAPGFATELMHLYLATDLSPAHPDERLGPDEDEHLRLERLPWEEALQTALAGEIADAKSLVGLLWVDRLRREGPAAEPSAAEAQGPPIERTFTYTRSEVVRTGMATMRRSRFVQVFGVIIAALALVPLINGDLSASIPNLLIAFTFLTGLFSLPFTLFAIWRYRDRIFQPSTVSIDGRGIRFAGQNARSVIEWRTFSRLRETDGFLWLEFGPQTFAIPLRVFTPDELATVRRLAAAAGFGPDGKPRRAGSPPTGR